MSIINSDGLNTNWQLNVLKGLQNIVEQLQDVNVDTSNFENLFISKKRTANFLRPTGTNGSVSAGVYSVSFSSVGTGDAIVGGMVLKPGETLNFDAGAVNNTINAITYNTTTNPGAELIIVTLT